MSSTAIRRPRPLDCATIADLPRAAAARFGDRPAIVDSGRTTTYSELAAAALECTRSLMARGVESGDRVAIWAPNIPEWIVAALGIHGAGATLVPINTRYKATEAAQILRRSRARLLFTVNGFLDTDYPAALRALADAPDVDVVVLRGDAGDGSTSWMELSAAAESIAPAAAVERVAAVRPDALADILFTSGTTGSPKGVMCTHAQNLRVFEEWARIVGLRGDDRYLVVAPFFHAFGYKAGWLASMLVGATVYPQPVFDVSVVLERVTTDGITVLPGPPALYQSILARGDLDDFDLGTLRLAVTGAATIPVSLIHRMRDRLGFQTIITAYGLTESTGVATMCRHDDDPEIIAMTSGRAISDVELRIVGADGESMPQGEPGEIHIRGYNVMLGYLDDPDSTADAIDADGWLKTGDVGHLDAAGNLTITDRIKDMFIVGGFNVYPAEVENALLSHALIAQAAVIGMPDERLGEVGCAFVVAKDGATLDPAAVVAFCRDTMANFKVPRRVMIVDELPRNAGGKVQKFVLRERLKGGEEPASGS